MAVSLNGTAYRLFSGYDVIRALRHMTSYARYILDFVIFLERRIDLFVKMCEISPKMSLLLLKFLVRPQPNRVTKKAITQNVFVNRVKSLFIYLFTSLLEITRLLNIRIGGEWVCTVSEWLQYSGSCPDWFSYADNSTYLRQLQFAKTPLVLPYKFCILLISLSAHYRKRPWTIWLRFRLPLVLFCFVLLFCFRFFQLLWEDTQKEIPSDTSQSLY